MNIQKRNIRVMLTMFIVMFCVLAVFFGYSVYAYGDQWFLSVYNQRISGAQAKVRAGDILDRGGAVLATTDSSGNRVYSRDMGTRLSVSHVVGDRGGQTSTGAETYMANDLYGFNDNVVERVVDMVSGAQRQGNCVELTLDSRLNKTVYDAISGYKGGAAIVMNYKTGEILSMVSTPGFDAEDMEAYITGDKNTNSPLINRATMGRYTPGSVFKIITTAAALKYLPDAESRTFTCTGSIDVDGVKVTDYEGEKHGKLKLADALEHSCNSYFAQLGLDLGASRINDMATELGFGTNWLLDDLILYTSSYKEGERRSDVAWSAVGQYKDLVTPMHMAMITACIANGGTMMEPKLVQKVKSSRGVAVRGLTSKALMSPLTNAEAETMGAMMRAVVKSGTGTGAQVKGVTVCGKTGTAEVSTAGKIKPNAWFTCFIQDEAHPYCVTVVLEDAGTGGSKAAPIAKKAIERAIELGY